MKKLLCLICTIVLLSSVTAGAVDFDGIDISRNKSELIISGTTETADTYCTIEIFKEDESLLYLGETKSNTANRFEFRVNLNIEKKETLTIRVKIGGEKEVREIPFVYEIQQDNGSGGGGGGSTPPSTGGGAGSSTIGSGGNVPTVPDKKAIFSDVDGHWAQEAVETLAERGIVTGIPDGTFAPNRTVTRSEFVVMAMRLLKDSAASYTGSFADVPEGAWYAGALQGALDAGLVSADELFRPDANITREEMTKILVSAYRLKLGGALGNATAKFADDGDISEWAREYVSAAVELGLVNGYAEDNTFRPSAFASRAEAAAMLSRLLEKLEA